MDPMLFMLRKQKASDWYYEFQFFECKIWTYLLVPFLRRSTFLIYNTGTSCVWKAWSRISPHLSIYVSSLVWCIVWRNPEIHTHKKNGVFNIYMVEFGPVHCQTPRYHDGEIMLSSQPCSEPGLSNQWAGAGSNLTW